MKGNEKVITALNSLLSDELTATNQYIVHSELCANWGYEKLHGVIEKRAIDEMKHAEKHIARIIFLEGMPVVSVLKAIKIGDVVEKQLANDLEAEYGAVKAYNDAIKLAVEIGDNGTREMLESILKDEEAHIDWIEAQQDQIKQMGLAPYLSEQTN
ncbi:MAG: bacterioferritin [Anaerolineaceae bacterium]